MTMIAEKLLRKEKYHKKSWIILVFYSIFYSKRHFVFQSFHDKFNVRNWQQIILHKVREYCLNKNYKNLAINSSNFV